MLGLALAGEVRAREFEGFGNDQGRVLEQGTVYYQRPVPLTGEKSHRPVHAICERCDKSILCPGVEDSNAVL